MSNWLLTSPSSARLVARCVWAQLWDYSWARSSIYFLASWCRVFWRGGCSFLAGGVEWRSTVSGRPLRTQCPAEGGSSCCKAVGDWCSRPRDKLAWVPMIATTSASMCSRDMPSRPCGHMRDVQVQHRHEIGRWAQPGSCLEVREPGGTDVASVGPAGAVRDEVDAELPLGRLDRPVHVALGHRIPLGGELEVVDQGLHAAPHLAAAGVGDLAVLALDQACRGKALVTPRERQGGPRDAGPLPLPLGMVSAAWAMILSDCRISSTRQR